MYTSRTRVTGFSGMDIDSLVSGLMEAESARLYKLQRNVQKLTWKQEAYRGIGNSLKTFKSSFLDYTNMSSNMRSKATFANFSTTITNSSGATSNALGITSSSKTKTGTYKVNILETAQTASLTGNSNTISSEDGADDGTIVTALQDAITKNEDRKFSFKATLNGDTATISVDITDLTNLQYAYNATDVEKAKIIETVLNEKLTEAFGTKVDPNATKEEILKDGSEKFQVPKVTVSIGNDGIVFSAGTGDIFKVEDIEDDSANNPDDSTTVTPTKTISISAFGIESGATNKVSLSATLEDVMGKTGSFEFKINEVKFSFDETKSLQEIMDTINGNSAVGATISYDSFNGQFKLEATESGKDVNLDIDDTDGVMKKAFGFDTNATRVEGKNSVIMFDGRLIESTSNRVEVSAYGLTLNLNDVTGTDTITVTIGSDVDSTYDKIKAFVDSYNELIENMQSSVKTTRARSDTYTYYEPLLDAEKAEMTEEQIKQYEEKAKVGMLYRDSIVSNIVSEMRSMMSMKVDLGDGRSISLSEIGINTSSDYTKGAILEIDEEKLRTAIEERGEDIAELFTKTAETGLTGSARTKDQGIAERLLSAVENATNNSSGTITAMAGFENSPSVASNSIYYDLKSRNDKIADMLEKLADKENAYYVKFSAMENAMVNAENQLNSLYSLMGQG